MKSWTESKIMIRALLVMLVGVIASVKPFLQTINVDLPILNKIAEYLTITNIDNVLNWVGLAIGVITGILGFSIWVERKRSQGEKIAPHKTLTRNYTKR